MDLTFFDLDHTLLAGDSDYEWGRFLVAEGIVDAEAYLRENDRFHEQYKTGQLDILAFQRFALQPLVDNPIERMHAVRARFVEQRIRPIVARHAPALLDTHRARGDVIAIITATNQFVTAPIAELLGVEHLIATVPEIIDGRYTGEVAGTPSYQAGKIERARQFMADSGQTFDHVRFYSDSHNDLPLLRWADTAIAVDPDDTLDAAARAAGWPIISLRGDTQPF